MSIESEFNGMQRGIREHTVPSGMAWPMFEDGNPVLLGDATEDCPNVSRISFTKRGFYFNSSHRNGLRRYRYGDAVKRPWAYDADGARTNAGDTVWNIGDGGKGVVTEVKGDSIVVDRNGGSIYGPAAGFVHEKPVYALDGFRVVEGREVFQTDYHDMSMTVVRIDHDTDAVLCKCECGMRLLPAKRLVAKLPDSWERLWFDMGVADGDDRMNGVEKDEFIRRATAIAKKAAV